MIQVMGNTECVKETKLNDSRKRERKMKERVKKFYRSTKIKQEMDVKNRKEEVRTKREKTYIQ